MTEKDSWQIDHYKTEYYLAKTQLETFKKYITFLEEKYRIRSMANFKEEFDKWCEEKKLLK